MAASTASRVAECLINLSHDRQDPVTNLKLQKLLYYAQAWHLVLFNELLFEDAIEAWVHGPVVPAVFRKYRDCRWSPILRADAVSVTQAVREHLEEVWKVYGKFDASKLERLTHSEAPWKEAREGLPLDVPSHNVITRDSMKAYYSTLVHA
jgi:uncharacterized phage-associated protein